MMITDDAGLKEIYATTKTIAIVGCSTNPERGGHYVPKFLQENGYRIIPVNPQATEILGEKCYPSLRDIPEKVDVVDCFRNAESMPEIVEEAIAIGAKVVWMQKGIVNNEAAERASQAGLKVVMNICMKEQHERLFPKEK